MSLILRVILFLTTLCFSVSASAQRVVSLLPSATFSAVQMGADANIVGRTSYCPKASEGTKSSVVGDAMTVNVEAIVALAPDVVIASPFTSQSVVLRLKSLGMKVVSFETPKNFDEICAQFLEIGRLTSHETEAQKVVDSERKNVEDIVSRDGKKNNLRFYFQIGANPLWGATPDYFISDMAKLLNGENVLSVGEGACAREHIVTRKPDVIVVSSLGGLASGEIGVWKKVTKAKCVVIDENVLCCPTPVFFRRSLQEIANAIR